MKKFIFTTLTLFLLLFAFSQIICAQTSPKLKLSREQQKNLDESLPLKVRKFLETADKFEIFMQTREKDGKLVAALQRDYQPNMRAELTDQNERFVLLKSFYQESATDEMGAICYLPSHSIRATKGNDAVEIEICFGCRKFYGKGSLGEFKGTLSRKEANTETIINRIIEKSGTDIK